ncbi:MAG: alpha/beta hydrolase [Nevskiaceae bacterium]|nr:MAG: alpha/beta hydrolase [Nevskiaceae bacterium]TAM25201.1 MAG: alpha/beta hydrolase [Nevskiaceae bacterium]
MRNPDSAAVPALSSAPDVPLQLGPGPVPLKPVQVRLRSRLIVWLLRKLLRPLVGWAANGSYARIAKVQLLLASQVCKDSSGQPLDYRVLGQVPGHVVGDIQDRDRPVILYLHGGGFLAPAVPTTHVWLLARMCAELGASGFMADYRLAPFNKFPAALDDCERAYQALLELGHDPRRIVVMGESAGGNLTLGTLQRIRKRGWPMPACAIPISPVTEMGRVHAPPSRALKMRRDPILPIAALQRVDELYAGDWDASDPELSPLYMDCSGLPPLYFLASDNEVLLDDTVLLARRAQAAGAQVKLDVWPVFPHAFPLFGQLFPEVRAARADMLIFMRQHLRATKD